MSEVVVLVAPTVMDGTVVRWYRSVAAAELHAPFLSASRNGVLVEDGVYLHTIPPEVLAAANSTYEALRRNPRADVSHLATHRHSVVANGPLVPVEGV